MAKKKAFKKTPSVCCTSQIWLTTAGVHVNEQGMVGAMAVATKDVRGYHVYVGIPAKSVRVKPNAPQAHTVLRTSSDRQGGASD